jgi:hypothetical protein
MTAMSKDRSNPARDGREKELIPRQYQHLAAVALLAVSIIVFFHEIVFEGKTFLSNDNLASHSFDTLLQDARQQGIFPLWNPYIFGGMPAYGSLTVTGNRWFDFSTVIFKTAFDAVGNLLNSDVGWVLVYYMVFAAGMYLFAYHKLQHKFIAFVTALSATFSMYIIIWVMSGHNTKIAVIAFFPYIFYSVERLRERFSLFLAILLVVLLHFAFTPSHVQMLFYVFLSLGVYLLFYLIRAFVKKEAWKPIVRTGIVLAAAALFAVAMDADRYLSVVEYNPYSIRGLNPITQSPAAADAKTVSGGLGYEYATSWSLGVGEVMTFFVPSWYGFGVTDIRGPLTQNQSMFYGTYMGPQPFTNAPQYMGIVITILAIIGFWRNRNNPFVQYLGLMIALSMLIAFGKEFSVVYDLMYKFFPGFNKFRVPSMILVLVQIMVPMLAGYGLLSFFSLREQTMSPASMKKWKYVLGGLAAVAVISLVAPSVVGNVYRGFIPMQMLSSKMPGQQAAVVSELYQHVVSMVTTDFLVGAFLLVMALGALYLYIRKLISLQSCSVLLVLAVGIDLWRVDYKPMEAHPQQQLQQQFIAPDYIRFVQQDSTVFRILQLHNGEAPLDNTFAYWRLQSAFGYQGAKMRWWQDLVDVAGIQNPLVWSLFNVKYILSDQPDSAAPLLQVYKGQQMSVYHNTANLPRAYFVKRYEVATGKEILEKIARGAFDPRDVAFFIDDPKKTVDPPHPNARAEMVRYGIQDLELKLTTAGNNLLVLSETYYPVGWKAFIDGNPTEIYRVNYLFRGVFVPSGVHTLTMKFEPNGFKLGKNASLVVNILVLGVLGFFASQSIRKKKALAQP